MRLLTSLVLAVCFVCAQSQTIWEDCVPINGVQVCADLVEQSMCDFHIKVSYVLGTLIDQEINLAVAKPTACGMMAGCELCFNLYNITRLNSQNASACAELTDSCLSLDQKLGCFVDATGALAQCAYSTCPNGCSGNGQCVAGVCNCDVGYAGSDCSQDQLAYQQCVDLGAPYGQACLNMEFEECAAQMTMTVGGLPIYKTDTPITAGNFGQYFASSMCVGAAAGCQGCLGWKNFQLNSTYMTGCPTFNMSCLGMPLGNYQLNCFTDTRLAPSCFGDCPAGCSNHGTCNNGVCACTDGYSGSTCSTVSCAAVKECSGQGTCTAPNTCSCLSGYSGNDCSVAKCDNGCSGHGTCTAPNKCTCDAGYMGNSCETPTCPNVCKNNGQCLKGQCICTNGWTGSDCSTKTSGNGSGGGGNGLAVGVTIGVVVALGAIGGGGFLYWRKRRNTRYNSAAFDDGLLQVPSSDE